MRPQLLRDPMTLPVCGSLLALRDSVLQFCLSQPGLQAQFPLQQCDSVVTKLSPFVLSSQLVAFGTTCKASVGKDSVKSTPLVLLCGKDNVKSTLLGLFCILMRPTYFPRVLLQMIKASYCDLPVFKASLHGLIGA